MAPDGQWHAGYVVVILETIIEAAPLPPGTTSKKAELIALTRALHLSKNLWVNIYTDSKYTYLITHTHSILWQEWGFLTTKGTPIVNGPLISKLLEALHFPTKVAIIHFQGHRTSQDLVSRGNNKADTVARRMAKETSSAPLLFLNTAHTPS
ncbi:unnamed protein product [Nyctereutes procyonoides]|uniref:(raccoon dog) hypothetical protein n=1 Tax=Nyctereutes procyonoides TaxID=34880 RepID=A0A811YXX6_NYCPR|nr:unnamed protein product [Nyctereutes procyonoides]